MTAWISRHRLISLGAGLALVVIGVVMFRYGIAKRTVLPCARIKLPCTDPVQQESKGWTGKVMITLGLATAFCGAVTSLLSALSKMVVAGRGLWHDVHPEPALATDGGGTETVDPVPRPRTGGRTRSRNGSRAKHHA